MMAASVATPDGKGFLMVQQGDSASEVRVMVNLGAELRKRLGQRQVGFVTRWTHPLRRGHRGAGEGGYRDGRDRARLTYRHTARMVCHMKTTLNDR